MMIGCVNLTNKVLFVRSDGKLTECSEYAAPATSELRAKMVVKNPKIAWNLYDFIPSWSAEPVLTCVAAGFGSGCIILDASRRGSSIFENIGRLSYPEQTGV